MYVFGTLSLHACTVSILATGIRKDCLAGPVGDIKVNRNQRQTDRDCAFVCVCERERERETLVYIDNWHVPTRHWQLQMLAFSNRLGSLSC